MQINLKQLEKDFPIVAQLLKDIHDSYLEEIYDNLGDQDNVEQLLEYLNEFRRSFGDEPLKIKDLAA